MKKVKESVNDSNCIEIVKAYLSLNKNSYIAWTYGDCGDAFNTRKVAEMVRNMNFDGLYDSRKQMDEHIPVYKMIFINGVPDCKLTAIEYMSSYINRSKKAHEL